MACFCLLPLSRCLTSGLSLAKFGAAVAAMPSLRPGAPSSSAASSSCRRSRRLGTPEIQKWGIANLRVVMFLSFACINMCCLIWGSGLHTTIYNWGEVIHYIDCRFTNPPLGFYRINEGGWPTGCALSVRPWTQNRPSVRPWAQTRRGGYGWGWKQGHDMESYQQ